MHRQSTEDFKGSGSTLYDTIMMDVSYICSNPQKVYPE